MEINIKDSTRALKIETFRRKTDSLRIPASRIAAVAGYNPFAILPELFLEFIYQGGHELRLQDARELRMQLVSADTLLSELAQKAGEATAKALESAMQVKDGTKTLANVAVADTLKRKVLEEAQKSKALNSEEIKKLAEGARRYVDTGFGTHHEDDALNLFEKKCGWKVRERNVSILNWPFLRVGDVTVKPMGPAKAREHNPIDLCTGEALSVGSSTTGGFMAEEPPKPYFIISGAVDGIRDELWCPPNDDEKSGIDEEWVLRKVIVECKHRMRRAYNTPPLYDQIQTTAYCLMYGAEEADIIQVLRKEGATKRQKLQPVTNEEIMQREQTKIDDYLEKKQSLEYRDVGKLTAEASALIQPCTTKKGSKARLNEENYESEVPEQMIEIVVSRISLDDSIMNHRHNWHSIVLPRLRSFVDAVYRVRANDELRKLFLEVVATEEQSGYATTVCWDMLYEELPWLKGCDHRYSA